MENKKKTLRPYQKEGVKYLRKNNGGCLFWEMRLGKTLTTVRYVNQIKKDPRVLIVGPYSVLPGWAQEVRENTSLDVVTLTGSAIERFNRLEATQYSSGVFLINKEAHRTVDFLRYEWDAIVIDECFITNPRAKVTKYFLNHTKPNTKRIILTGTPAPESELQYFCPLYWIDPYILGYKDFWTYRIKRFKPIGFDLVMPLKDRKWLSERLSASCSILTRKDAGLYKEKIYETRYITFSPASRKKYLQIEKDAMLGDEVLKYAGSRRAEMRRLCAGEEKQEELLTLLSGELKGKRLVIYCWFVEEIEVLSELLKCPAIYGNVPHEKREQYRLKFQSGIYPILVIQPETVKFGACFSNAEAAIFYSRPESLLTNLQVEERTEDLSTEDSTLVVDLVVQNTIEESIIESIKAKETRVAALDRMRRDILRRQNHG